MIYIQLFLTFFVIGLFTIGGGYAMLSIIQGQVVGVHGWVDTKTFTDIVADDPGPDWRQLRNLCWLQCPS